METKPKAETKEISKMKRVNKTDCKKYYTEYHRDYYRNNRDKIKRKRNIQNFKKTYTYLPEECFDDFKKDKVVYLKIIKKKLNKKIILSILEEYYKD